MLSIVRDVIIGFDWFVLGYFLVLNSIYLLLVTIAALDVAGIMRRAPFSGHDDIFANPLTPGVSVIVPAFNEEAGILQSVEALLGLKYPALEIIVVDDGSTDATFSLLSEQFGLVETERVVFQDVPTVGKIRSMHVAANGAPLLVIRKDNAGRRADPLNVGINAASQPFICMVDADSLLDEDALLRVAKPFVDDPEHVVGIGGVVRVANGSTVERGRVVDPRMPAGWVARIQVVEYLRSFLLGRTGWSRLGGLLIISGAFGLFRRDLLVELGGMDLKSIGEDAELVAKIHYHMRSRGRRDYRVAFVAEPVCWTEVPDTLAALAVQRKRWSRGLAQVLFKHRRMIANPRFGRIGLVVFPYYLIFELFGAAVELGGLVVVAASIALGLLNASFAILFVLVAFGLGIFLSCAAITLEEFSFRRYRRWRDLAIGVVAAVLENVGYRQLHAWWRLRGLISELRGADPGWGVMARSGFAEAPPAAPAKVVP
jgi:cellulose synthase/poly-beta-1,6-N-acetylglucosamine synthase-like glycosyltransferase